MPAFGYEKKLIIVKNELLFKKEPKKNNKTKQTENSKLAEYIENNIEDIFNSNVLVFICEKVEKNELYTTIEKNGIVCNFEKLKLQQIVARLKTICNAYKVNVDNFTLEYLIQISGTNMQDLINEIRKLIEYTRKRWNYKKRRCR